ncbi:hypothetical protein AVEN_203662-1 [Araneus ventricosus]|uniref:Uncharacterized protein n=1 Tax=Araneus ventricosus TaxID=182803 RepID=A0A4Y2F021_ARAVE|nr:hypothetical protein AVEN_203662-1 [Araneus ventricosus]
MGHAIKGPFGGLWKTANNFPENIFDNFLVIKRDSESNGTFQFVMPFLVEKAVVATIVEDFSFRKLGSDDFLVEVYACQQVQKIFKLKALATIPITVSAHTSLIASKGVINCRKLFNVLVEIITDELKSQGAVMFAKLPFA